MAVSALELRPRGAIGLFDAALELCARHAGLWAFGVSGGALVTAALLNLLSVGRAGDALLVPSLLLALAWLVRGLFMGASCHLVEQQLLGRSVPTMSEALAAALRRAPSLMVASTYLVYFQLFTTVLTLGLGALLLGSHLAAFAVTMQGKGHPLALYNTCSRILGPARPTALGVRRCFAVQPLVFFNLHLGATLALTLGQKLLGLDLGYFYRFASLDNEAWLLTLGAVTFTLFEPLRAATGALLVLEGRVRQEGLDLLAQVEQLPDPTSRMRRPGEPTDRGASATAALVLGLGLALGLLSPDTAHAAQTPSASRALAPFEERLRAVAADCELEVPEAWLSPLEPRHPDEAAALDRYLSRLEEEAAQASDSCDRLQARLERPLPSLEEGTSAGEGLDAEAARQRARAILARPEFQASPTRRDAETEAEDQGKSLWERFLDWLGKLLQELAGKEAARPNASSSAPLGLELAQGFALVLIALAVLAALWLVFRSLARRPAKAEAQDGAGAALVEPQPLALSRAPEGWAELGDELAAAGNFREAIRSLYLALLAKLHREGAIDYDPAKSNWDYFRGFQGPREWLAAFRELTRRFDVAFYGNLDTGADAYRTFKALSRPILSATTEAQPAAGESARA